MLSKSIPHDIVHTLSLYLDLQSPHELTEDIVNPDFQWPVELCVYPQLNRRRWVEWVGIVPEQLERRRSKMIPLLPFFNARSATRTSEKSTAQTARF